MTPPPLTVEEQLRIVADTWLNDHDRNQCEWIQVDAHLTLLFGRGRTTRGYIERERLSLLLRLDRPGLAALATIFEDGAYVRSIRPIGGATPEDIAAWLELEIDWANLEPF